MDTRSKKALSDFTDRELAEMQLATTLRVNRKLQVLESFLMTKYKKEYTDHYNSTSLREDIEELVVDFHPSFEEGIEEFLYQEFT